MIGMEQQAAQTDASGNGLEISKKDLLREMGISYGQFYRWKRMGLIPEAWFHRRSTFTGQETFLPREKIVARIRQIQGLKDEHSLNDLADMLSADATGRQFDSAQLQAAGVFSPAMLALLPEPPAGAVSFVEALALAAMDRLSKLGLGEDVLRAAGRCLLERYTEIDGQGEQALLVLQVAPGQPPAQPTTIALCGGKCLVSPKEAVAAEVSLGQLAEKIRLQSKLTS